MLIESKFIKSQSEQVNFIFIECLFIENIKNVFIQLVIANPHFYG